MADKSLAGGLLSLMGISGAGLPTDTIAPRATGTTSDEMAYASFLQNTQLADPNAWSFYRNRMDRPSTLDEQLRMWEEMATWDLLAAALTEFVDEATQPDYNTGRSIWYECSDREVEKSLNNMLDEVEAENFIQSQMWYVAGLGNNFEKLHYEPGRGILGMTFVHPMDVRRFWLAKNRRCVGFRWRGNNPNNAALWQQGSTVVPRVAVSANTDAEDLWYPWDFMHMRRMCRMRISENGEAIYDEAQGIYKKLRMSLDQMLVHRAQVQPDRYVVNIDVQEQPPLEQMKTVHRWKQQLRSKLSFGGGPGGQNQFGSPTDFKSYYDAMALDTIFWMARPKGFQHGIEKLAGTANIPDVYDVELLLNLLFSVIRMPKSWFGIGDKADGGPSSGKALLAQDMRFLRGVKSVRQPVRNAYTWMGYFHAILINKDPAKLNIQAKMSDISSLEDSMRLDLLNAQMELLTKMGDVMEAFALPKDALVELMFKRYLHLPDDIVNTIMTALPAEKTAAAESTKKRPISKGSAMSLVEGFLARDSHAAELFKQVRQLADGLETGKPPPIDGYRIFKSFRQSYPDMSGQAAGGAKPLVESGDVVVDSYDQIADVSKQYASAGQKVQQQADAHRRWGPTHG